MNKRFGIAGHIPKEDRTTIRQAVFLLHLRQIMGKTA